MHLSAPVKAYMIPLPFSSDFFRSLDFLKVKVGNLVLISDFQKRESVGPTGSFDSFSYVCHNCDTAVPFRNSHAQAQEQR